MIKQVTLSQQQLRSSLHKKPQFSPESDTRLRLLYNSAGHPPRLLRRSQGQPEMGQGQRL